MIVSSVAPSAREWRAAFGRVTRDDRRTVVLYAGRVAALLAPRGAQLLEHPEPPAAPARRPRGGRPMIAAPYTIHRQAVADVVVYWAEAPDGAELARVALPLERDWDDAAAYLEAFVRRVLRLPAATPFVAAPVPVRLLPFVPRPELASRRTSRPTRRIDARRWAR